MTAELEDLQSLEIVWLSDGHDYGAATEFSDALAALAGGKADVSVLSPAPENTALAIGTPSVSDGGIEVTVRRANTGTPLAGSVRALALNGRSLGDAPFAFETDQTEAEARLELPVALRNQVARLEVVGVRTAGAVFLLDDRWRRKTVGLISGEASEVAQPLLSPLYYLQRALEPFADLKVASTTDPDASLETLLTQGLSVLVMADIGNVLAGEKTMIEEWVSNGGIVIRFAGPRLAGGSDDLVPVKLRRGGRALGGALSWSKPQPLSPFETDSPFFGLEVSPDINVKRQVLAQPSADLTERTWARLADGTPLVTGARTRQWPHRAVPRAGQSGMVEPAHVGPVRRNAQTHRRPRTGRGRQRRQSAERYGGKLCRPTRRSGRWTALAFWSIRPRRHLRSRSTRLPKSCPSRSTRPASIAAAVILTHSISQGPTRP